MAIKAGTALSLVGPKGPVGDQGQATPALGSLCFAAGPQGYLNGASSSAAGVWVGTAGISNAPAMFMSVDATALLGATIVNYSTSTAAFSFALVNVTTGATLYSSAAYGAGTVNTVGVFSQTAYVMPAGNRYQWRCIGAGTAYCSVQPYYMLPSNAAIAASTVQLFSLPPTVTLSSGGNNLLLPGTNATNYLRLPRSGYLYSAVVANNSTSPVTIQFCNQTTNVVIAQYNVAASAVATLGPFTPSTCLLLANNNYIVRATGTAPADLQVQVTLVS
jgi:hypothetical protein